MKYFEGMFGGASQIALCEEVRRVVSTSSALLVLWHCVYETMDCNDKFLISSNRENCQQAILMCVHGGDTTRNAAEIMDWS